MDTMRDMATRKKPDKGDGGPSRRRSGVNLNVWLPQHLMEAFERLLARTRRSKTTEAEIMMEKYLKDEGELP